METKIKEALDMAVNISMQVKTVHIVCNVLDVLNDRFCEGEEHEDNGEIIEGLLQCCEKIDYFLIEVIKSLEAMKKPEPLTLKDNNPGFTGGLTVQDKPGGAVEAFKNHVGPLDSEERIIEKDDKMCCKRCGSKLYEPNIGNSHFKTCNECGWHQLI